MTLQGCPSPWQPKRLRPRTIPERGLGLWEQLGLGVDAAPLWVLSFIVRLLCKNHEPGFGQEQLLHVPSALMAQDEVMAKEN